MGEEYASAGGEGKSAQDSMEGNEGSSYALNHSEKEDGEDGGGLGQ